MWLWCHFLFLTDYIATKTFRDCWGFLQPRALTAASRGQPPRLERMAKSFAGIRTRSMVAICFMLHPSAPTPVLPISSSNRLSLQKVEILLALGFFYAR